MSEQKNYAFWFKSLEDQSKPDQSQALGMGFYRMHGAKTKADYPVAIWGADLETLTLKVGYKTETVKDKVLEFEGMAWLNCTAVYQEEYDNALSGGRWADGKAANSPLADDDKKSEKASEPKKEAEAAPTPEAMNNRPKDLPREDGERVIGPRDNGGPAMGEEFAEKVKAEATLLKSLVTEVIKGEGDKEDETIAKPIISQEVADKVAEIRERLGKARIAADKERTLKKAPYLKSGKEVDDAFNPAIARAKILEAKVVNALQPFLDNKKKVEQDRLNKIAAEETEKAKQKAREEAELAAEDPAEAEKTVEAVKPKEAVVKAGGGTARATTSNRRKNYRGEITDPKAFYDAIWHRLEASAFMTDVAGRIARENKLDGPEVAGLKVIEE